MCRRDFEYYSEDPEETGNIDAAYVNGVQSNGVGTSIKRIGSIQYVYRLMEISDLIHEHLPWVTSIGEYARIDNLKNKTIEQLRDLTKVGYGGFYFGIESGDDVLLRRMHKGYTSEDIVKQMSKLGEAGMPFVGNFLGGLGGHGYGLSHARETARVSNIIRPDMIYASELTLFPDTPLVQDVKDGKYEEATEVERLQEMQEFLRCLTIPTVFKAEHVTMPSPIRGQLPEDRDRMIQELQSLIDLGEDRLRAYRDQVHGL